MKVIKSDDIIDGHPSFFINPSMIEKSHIVRSSESTKVMYSPFDSDMDMFLACEIPWFFANEIIFMFPDDLKFEINSREESTLPSSTKIISYDIFEQLFSMELRHWRMNFSELYTGTKTDKNGVSLFFIDSVTMKSTVSSFRAKSSIYSPSILAECGGGFFFYLLENCTSAPQDINIFL